MKNVLCFGMLFFLLGIKTFSQGKDLKYKKWIVGIGLEPAYTYRVLNYSSSEGWIQEFRDEQENPAMGFNAGLIAQRFLTKEWSIECGIQFTNRAFATRKETLIWEITDENYPTSSKIRYAFHYIEIPLTASYHWQIGKLGMFASTGISISNFTNKRTTVITYFQNKDSNRDNSNVNYGYNDTYSIILAVGINLSLSQRFFLSFEPTYRRNFTSVNKEEMGREYFNSLGLKTKLNMRIKATKK